MAVYTHNYAAEILDAVDDMLCRYGIKVPSDEDGERGEDNDAALYGTTWGELMDEVESILVEMANRASREDIIAGIFE